MAFNTTFIELFQHLLKFRAKSHSNIYTIQRWKIYHEGYFHVTYGPAKATNQNTRNIEEALNKFDHVWKWFEKESVHLRGSSIAGPYTDRLVALVGRVHGTQNDALDVAIFIMNLYLRSHPEDKDHFEFTLKWAKTLKSHSPKPASERQRENRENVGRHGFIFMLTMYFLYWMYSPALVDDERNVINFGFRDTDVVQMGDAWMNTQKNLGV